MSGTRPRPLPFCPVVLSAAVVAALLSGCSHQPWHGRGGGFGGCQLLVHEGSSFQPTGAQEDTALVAGLEENYETKNPGLTLDDNRSGWDGDGSGPAEQPAGGRPD